MTTFRWRIARATAPRAPGRRVATALPVARGPGSHLAVHSPTRRRGCETHHRHPGPTLGQARRQVAEEVCPARNLRAEATVDGILKKMVEAGKVRIKDQEGTAWAQINMSEWSEAMAV